MAMQRIKLTLNGKTIEKDVECRQNLADFLRHDESA